MKYEFIVGNYQPTDYGVKRLFNTFKKSGRPYQLTIIKKKAPWALVDKEIIILANNEPPIILPNISVFKACFVEKMPNYALYGINADKA